MVFKWLGAITKAESLTSRISKSNFSKLPFAHTHDNLTKMYDLRMWYINNSPNAGKSLSYVWEIEKIHNELNFISSRSIPSLQRQKAQRVFWIKSSSQKDNRIFLALLAVYLSERNSWELQLVEPLKKTMIFDSGSPFVVCEYLEIHFWEKLGLMLKTQSLRDAHTLKSTNREEMKEVMMIKSQICFRMV